ncbi:hypothetical protein [uncultured Nostoc sp.]|uniref:hypothetical protein n=1 Tax=uncultured Nostoc sp. TaxID=340711 RepID=UPI0035CC7977
MSALQLSLTEKIRKATALLPPAHLVPPCETKYVFATQAEAKTRYQNWAFTQGFTVVVEKNDLKHGFYVLECVRHKKQTKNSRKKEEGDYVRPASKINAINCQFRLRITWQAKTQNWQLISAFLQHNHAMSPDPFVFTQHRDRDPDRQQVETLAHHIHHLAKQSAPYVNMAFLLREKITTIFRSVQAKELRRQNSIALLEIWSLRDFTFDSARNIRLKEIFEVGALWNTFFFAIRNKFAWLDDSLARS